MANIELTKTKYDELSEKLTYLETTRRSEISQAIKAAKEFGDLSENAEYSAAKDEQVANETEIARLTETLNHATIIDESSINTRVVGLGNIVKICEEPSGETDEYTIVSSLESDIANRKISNQSPIGKALVGHRKGDTVTAHTPAGDVKFKILEISK